MRVEKVWVNKFQSGKLLGFADILFSLREGGNGILNIKGFKIFRDDNGSGLQVALPSKKDDKGGYLPLLTLAKDDPDSVAFMDHLKEKVSIAYNSAPDTRAPEKSSKQIRNDPNPSGIPF